MTHFRIDVSRETRAIMLCVEAPCGFKPIIAWAGLEGVKEFAEMLLGFYNSRKEGKDESKAVSDNLLQQALGDKEYF